MILKSEGVLTDPKVTYLRAAALLQRTYTSKHLNIGCDVKAYVAFNVMYTVNMPMLILLITDITLHFGSASSSDLQIEDWTVLCSNT